MGNQQSVASTINDTINKSISNVLTSSTNCSQNNTVDAMITFQGIKTKGGCKLNFSDINQTINAAPNMTCAQSAANQAALASQFQTELNQNAAAQTSGLSGALNSDAVTSALSTLECRN